jgi:hypothetical protein
MEGTMERLLKTKAKIVESGKTLKQVAKEAGIHPTLLSLAIGGRYNLKDSEKAAIAEAVGRPVDEVFSR